MLSLLSHAVCADAGLTGSWELWTMDVGPDLLVMARLPQTPQRVRSAHVVSRQTGSCTPLTLQLAERILAKLG